MRSSCGFIIETLTGKIRDRRLKLLNFPEENVSDLRGLRVCAFMAHVKHNFYGDGF
jgi:hypothetical protein